MASSQGIIKQRKILFSGDRNATFQSCGTLIYQLVEQLTSQDLVIHGGCKGVDAIVDHYARQKGCQIKVFDADWSKYGRAAGPMLAEKPDLVICLHPDLKQSKGTRNMYNAAIKGGYHVEYIQI